MRNIKINANRIDGTHKKFKYESQKNICVTIK